MDQVDLGGTWEGVVDVEQCFYAGLGRVRDGIGARIHRQNRQKMRCSHQEALLYAVRSSANLLAVPASLRAWVVASWAGAASRGGSSSCL